MKYSLIVNGKMLPQKIRVFNENYEEYIILYVKFTVFKTNS